MIKAIITIHHTKRDIYGNVYYMAEIKSARTGKSFSTSIASEGNLGFILRQYGLNHNQITQSVICTGSARLSSLPTHQYFDQCRLNQQWKTALYKIGIRQPRKDAQ